MKYKFTKAEQETVINFDNELDAMLLERKKSSYAEYRKTKSEMAYGTENRAGNPERGRTEERAAA